MIKKHVSILSFISFFSIAIMAKEEPKYILVDTASLFLTDESIAGSYVGKAGGALYLVEKFKLPNQEAFFSALKRIAGESTQKTYNNGLAMPQVLCDWLLSIKQNAVLKAEILTKIKDSVMQKGEKMVFSDIVEMMLTPTKLVHTLYINTDLLDTMKSLSAQKYTIVLAGNYDTESLIALKNNFQEAFSYIDLVIVSGEIKQLKPSKDFYHEVLNKVQEYLGLTNPIKPEECICFETEKKFIDAVKAEKMPVIVSNDKTDKKYFKQQLAQRGITV